MNEKISRRSTLKNALKIPVAVSVGQALLFSQRPTTGGNGSAAKKKNRKKVTVGGNEKSFKESPLQKGFPSKALNSITLDPNDATYLCSISGGGQGKMIGRIDGQWSEGPGKPWWGPGGDPNTMFNGFHRDSCLIVVFETTSAGNHVLSVIEDDAQDGWEVDNIGNTIVFVAAEMNAPHGSNINNPANPMRATLGV